MGGGKPLFNDGITFRSQGRGDGSSVRRVVHTSPSSPRDVRARIANARARRKHVVRAQAPVSRPPRCLSANSARAPFTRANAVRAAKTRVKARTRENG